MSYTSVFGGTTIYPSDVSYLPLALAADTTLEWPLEASGDITVAARIIGVTPASAGRSVIMPDATRTGTGQSVLFNNMGPTHSFLVKDDAGTTLATVAPGTQWQIYLTDNTTAAGTWEVYQMGASTATVQASALAGPGLMVVGSQLAQAALFTQFTGNLAPTAANRAVMYVYTGTGAATVSLPTASAVDNKYFVRIRNQGTGVLTVDPAGTDLINGVTSLNLAPEDSAMIICDGLSNWYTVGLGQNAEFTFDFVSIPVGGGTLTLSGAQLNRIAYRFTGTLTANQIIVVPDTVQQYWVDNQTTGSFTLGLKTASQVLPTLVNQNASAIMYCDGAEVVLADTSTIGLPVAVAQGGTGATTPSGARANLGITPFADPLVTASGSPAAQAVLFPGPITDGQVLVGNAATPGFAQTTLTAGTGIGILNGPGSVTITNTGTPAPGSVYSQLFSGTGAQTAFTLAYQPFSEDNTQVYINGVYQQKNTYSLSGFTITFSTAPVLGTNNIEVVVIQVVPIGTTNANLVNYTPAYAGAVAETVQSKLEQLASVKDFGATGDGVTDDTTAVQSAVASCYSTGADLYWPEGTYRTTASVPNFHSVRHSGPGVVTRGADSFHIENANTLANNLYVAVAGNDANDGMSASQPLATLQRAIDVWQNYTLTGSWVVKLAAGSYSTGANNSATVGFDFWNPAVAASTAYTQNGVTADNFLTIQGPDVGYDPLTNPRPAPTAIFEGGGAALTGLAVRYANVIIKDIKFREYNGTSSSSGISGATANIRTLNVHTDDCAVGISNTKGNLEVQGGWVYGNATKTDTVGIRSIFQNRHAVGNQAALGAGQGPLISFCTTGALVQESSTGHFDSCEIEDCVTGLRVTVNSRINYSYTDFKRNGVAIRYDFSSNTFGFTTAVFNTNTADANDENLVKQSFASSADLDAYANSGLATDYLTTPYTLTGSTASVAILSKTLEQGAYAPVLSSVRNPQEIKFRAYGTQSGTAGVKQFKLRMGSTVLASITNAASDVGDWRCEGNITFLSPTSQTAMISYMANVEAVRVNVDTGTENMNASAKTLSFEVQLADGADTVVVQSAVFEVWG